MPFSTFGVATAVTPSVIETYFSHYLNRKPLKQKPTAHISYHEGLKLIRQFLDYSSKHTVEELQAFTAQWVPVPTWVRTQDVEVPPQFLKRSANLLRKQLGSDGMEQVGGEKWWQWRKPDTPLHAEWIEMKKDHQERKREGKQCDRVILYIHGGAYYFGSVDEHRYQMQRHARKLKARVLAPRYRLAPQFPFPCGLHDCIATYFYLLEHFDPSQVLFAGDSAGGGMVLSMLVTLRDQGCPLPAGTILLSPWVDLTHSFPSVAGEGLGDYIPPHGFHHKPSMAWPPPPTTDDAPKKKRPERTFTQPVEQPFDVVELPASYGTGMTSKQSRDNLRGDAQSQDGLEGGKETKEYNQIPGMGPRLEIAIGDKLVVIREQFQMYAKNDLLAHPLVSPVQQPSLGGLPPMLIQVGGAELLRDEQIYLAHKAANPRQYPPGEAVMEQYDPERTILNQYPGTDVQLQVWEDLCHVPHTLSFTRPAKYMYRSVAQFGAWALARAQHKSIEILDDDAISIISDKEDPNEYGKGSHESFGSIGEEGVTSTQFKLTSIGAIGKAGDDLPPFKDHMIRQRVNRHGIIFPLPRVADIACLNLDRNTIGAIKTGPVHKWLMKRGENDVKFANDYKKLQKKKLKEAKDYDQPEPGENPAAAALINRKIKGNVAGDKKKGKSWGLAMWSGWGSSHDESTIQREERLQDAKEADAERPSSVAASTRTATGVPPGSSSARATALSGADVSRSASSARNNLAVPSNDADDAKRRRRSSASVLASAWGPKRNGSRTRSPYRSVKDEGQANNERDAGSPVPPGSPNTMPDSPSRLRDLSRRSSVNSTKVNYARPISSATMLSSNLNPNAKNGKVEIDEAGGLTKAGPANDDAQVEPPSPSVPPASQARSAPSMSDAGKAKDAVRVSGSVNTFLNAANPRPHNGVVAYPFKLGKRNGDIRSPSPNPSTMTLDSNADDRDFEMPTGFGVVTPVELPTEAYAGRAASPGVVETPALVHSPETDIVPAELAVPQPTLDATDTISTRPRPVSALPEGTRLSNIAAPEEDPVSPLETLPTPGSATSNSSFKQTEYRSRDSRLGQLGADGMPTHAWPESEPVADNVVRPTPPPFKIRNPVYDARAPNPSPAAPAPSAQSSSVPFKMRHTIYDSKVAPPGSKPPGQPQSEQFPDVSELPASNGWHVEEKQSMPSADSTEEAGQVPRGPSPSSSASKGQHTAKSSTDSTELSSPAYKISKQASTSTTIDQPAPSLNSLNTTNGQASLASPLPILPTRLTANRDSSTDAPPPPPRKDTPPQTSVPPTVQPPPLPSTISGDNTQQAGDSQLNSNGHAPSVTKPGLPIQKSADNLKLATQLQFPQRIDSMPRSTDGTESNSRSSPTAAMSVLSLSGSARNRPQTDRSNPTSTKKSLTLGTSAAQAAVQAPAELGDSSPVSPVDRSTINAAPPPTIPRSKFSMASRRTKINDAAIRGTHASASSPPTIGNLTFEHEPLSPLESGRMELSSSARGLETSLTADEELKIKDSVMENKI
ncbi:unnamed protein product [Cercospora beticola]|nr:unnamed protein product [Cercospora beticola]